MDKAEKGELAYSITAMNKSDADAYKAAVKEVNKGRVLIKDLEDTVGFTLSMVPNPCVNNSCSAKNNPNHVNKSGRAISNVTRDTLQSAYDSAKNSLDNLKGLLDKAKGERPDKEEIDMNKEELGELIDEKLTPIKSEIEGVKKSVEDIKGEGDPGGNPDPAIKCTKCEHELKGAVKFCPECGDKIESEPSEVDSLKSEVESQKSEIETLKEQVNKSNDLSGNPDNGTPKVSNKRDLNGCPVEKKW